MKKFILFFFSFPYLILAAPAGNPSLPSIIEEGFIIPDVKIVNFRVGYQTYDCQDLIMKFDDQAQENDFYSRKIEAFCNSAIFTVNVKERLDLYTEVGSCRLEPVFKHKKDLYNAKSENDIFYRLGTRVIFIEILDFTLSADVKYSIYNSACSYLIKNNKPLNDNSSFKMNEWQIAVGISQKITILRPYFGIAYRDTKIRMENTFFNQDLNLIYKKKIGVFLGTSVSLGSFILLNGEIKLINERATIISGELRF